MAIDRFITLKEAADESGTKLEYMKKVCKKHGITVYYCTNDIGDDAECVKLSEYVAVFGWGG